MPLPPTGMRSALAALRYWERRQEVASNNLANVSTTGFKQERVFARLLDGEVTVPDAATDMRGGALTITGNPLDLAMGGDGLFVVQGTNGERLTRGGSFRLDTGRRLVDAAGNALLGRHGAVTVPDGGAVEVDRAGRVTVDGREVDRLRIETVPPGASLAHEGGTLFVPGASRAELPDDRRDVRQGALEDANVDPVSAMVDMITIQRAYANTEKAVVTMDEIRRTISNDLGKVG